MKISILLPNFNDARFLPQAIDAIRAQSHRDWELAIVDDASTDNSRELIEDYTRRDPRITAEFLARNEGVVATLRRAYDKTSASLVFGASADDFLTDDRFLEKAVDGFQATPDAGCAFARVQMRDEDSGQTGATLGEARHAGFTKPRDALHAFLTGHLFIHGAAVVWKRELVDKVGGYDAELGPQADFFIHHALAALAGAIFIDDVVAVVRTSKDKFSRSTDDAQYFRAYAGVERKIRELDLGYRVPPAWLRRWRRRTIDGRLAAHWQRRFFAAARPSLVRLRTSWEGPLLPDDLAEPVRQLEAGIDTWSADIEKRVQDANAIFDTIAGPLPGARLRDWLRPARRAIGRAD